MYMNDFDEEPQQTQAELDIQKRRDEVEKAIQRNFRAIFRKPIDQLSQYDKGFLQARRSYLTEAERKTYEKVLSEDLLHIEIPMEEFSRNDLNKKALDLGIEKPEDFPNKTELIAAIREAQNK